MVNENLIPKTEMVYEIKNEIPSYEEFMKDYKLDENLNYDDLNSGSVGEVKGYGPCDSRFCKHYLDEGYVPLYLRCPAKNCGGDGNPYQWVHDDDDCYKGHAYISKDLYIKCMKCKEVDHMRNWVFSCNKHPGRTNAREGTVSHFRNALSFIANLYENEDRDPVTRRIIRIISDKLMEEKGW